MTQAVNLANFANYLDSGGGMAPSALNAAVPLSKGGTNATNASDARTNLGVDYATIYSQIVGSIYPVGSLFTSTVSTNPATLLGFGTWVAFGAGRVLIGNGGGFTAGSTGGSADAVVVSHTHTATDSGHTHVQTVYSAISNGGNVPVGFSNVGGNASGPYSTQSGTANITVASSGTSGTNANLQPYIVVYMWNRTA